MATLIPIIGMETHAELKTKSKMFCGCKNDPFYAPKPNVYTCPVCLGLPGALPVANKTAIEWTIKLGLALKCEINLFSKFDRKNYFYPDLPKGYQISQYDIPFCVNGVLETEEGPVRIRRIHLEEDTGKLQHTTIDGKKVSLIDYNRSSVPLVEIVTEPDIHSGKHAKSYGKKLRQILRYLDISDCNMEQGSLRLEANISLSENAEVLPNYKVEVKNINSFGFLEKAINYEVQRQTQVLSKGEIPTQETRGWSESKNATFSQRTKEDAEDYRYFPDPDLPPLQFTKVQIDQWESELPKLPDDYNKNFISLNIKPQYAATLSSSPTLASLASVTFSTAQDLYKDINLDTLGSAIVNKKISINENPINEIEEANRILEKFLELNKNDDIDEDELNTIIESVLSEQPKAVEDYKAGKVQILGFLMGQVMKKIGKKIDPKLIQEHLKNHLK